MKFLKQIKEYQDKLSMKSEDKFLNKSHKDIFNKSLMNEVTLLIPDGIAQKI